MNFRNQIVSIRHYMYTSLLQRMKCCLLDMPYMKVHQKALYHVRSRSSDYTTLHMFQGIFLHIPTVILFHL